MSESAEQQYVFSWLALKAASDERYDLAFAVPNGQWLAGTKEAKAKLMSKYKREGLKPGVPDLFLAYPAKGFHGLFIEMKFGKNKVSPHQDGWLRRLGKAGYATAVCCSGEKATKLIKHYVEGVE